MSRHSESGVDNRVFSAVMATLAMTLFALWFFIHPNSPWHVRNEYVVHFDEIGTLVAGNDVQINGLSKGKVLKSELTDSCVWVRLQILAEAQIPANSSFRIVNAGLMGERVVDIRLGDSPQYLASGDTVQGQLDKGSTRLAMMIVGTLREINGLIQTGSDLIDTVLSPENQQSYENIARKGNRLLKNGSAYTGAWKDSLQQWVITLNATADKTQEIWNELEPQLQLTADSLQILRSQILALRAPLSEVKQRTEGIIAQLQATDNTAGLVLETDQLRNQFQELSGQAKALMERIQKSGLDLNVDIW